MTITKSEEEEAEVKVTRKTFNGDVKKEDEMTSYVAVGRFDSCNKKGRDKTKWKLRSSE